MTKLIKHTRHVINWNPNAHTVVRGCTEPYDQGPTYKPGKADQGKLTHKRPFTVAESRTKREKRNAEL